jgi:hypothetical protein
MSTTQQEILVRAAAVLRRMATISESPDRLHLRHRSIYIWHITHAIQALRDGNPTEAGISLESMKDMETAENECDRGPR